MINRIYIEQELADHPRVEEICTRFPKAARVYCDRYGEIFNRKAQNFRLQKRRPALILAKKFKNFVQAAPDAYAIGGGRNYYFSHLLNCIYDCRYCFLQGMYRSAYYVLFVNYEDFYGAIQDKISAAVGERSFFFSGYDSDSLALEPVTRFVEHFIPFFSKHPHAWLELRTKSTQIRSLLDRAPIDNCVVAFSFTPEEMAQALEHKVPSVERRLHAMRQLQQHGWRLGLRFDPLIYQAGYKKQYERLFGQIFQGIDAEKLHSVSLGSFRVPVGYYRNMVDLYPEEKLFAGPLEKLDGMARYPHDIEHSLMNHCKTLLLRYISPEIFFPCATDLG